MDDWHGEARRIIDRQGGASQLAAYEHGLREALAHRPATHVLRSREGAVEQIYRDLVDLLATHGGTTP